MANSDGGIELNLRVNTETGSVDQLGGTFLKAADSAKTAETAFAGLSEQAKSLLGSLLPIASAVGVITFFSDAVKGAEEQNEAMRRLQFTLESNGQAWKDGGAAIKQWADSITATTRFTDNEALQSLDKLARSTASVSQAQAAAKLAMDLSVTSGKSLGEMTDFVNNLINKQERAITQAHKEFGTYTEKATTAQEVLDVLAKKVSGAADKEDSLTKTSKQLASAFDEFKNTVGNSFTPALTSIITTVTAIIRKFDEFGSAVAASMMVAFEAVKGYNTAILQALTGHFSAAKATVVETTNEIKNITTAATEQIAEEEKKKQALYRQTGDTHIDVTKRELEAEKAAREAAQDKINSDDAKFYDQWSKKMEEQAQKARQLDLQISDGTLKVGNETFDKKKQIIDNEYNYKKAEINKEIFDETAKKNLLDKLELEHSAQVQNLIKQDQLTRFNSALDTVDLATQTLSIINQMGQQHSAAEVNRAKAILALEKSIAIARAIAAAMAAPPGFAQAIAAAQVALITAQFAQQMQAIDQAQAQYKAGQQSSGATSSIDTSLSGGGASLPSAGSSLPAASSGGGVSTGGGGGGGGGSVTINVGGVNVMIAPDKLSIDNIDVVMQKITEAVRQGTIEGIQLAVTLQNLAAKNSNLAVG